MIFTTPGKVSDRIWLLGRKESTIYLLKGGDDYALVGGGMVHIAPDVVQQLQEFNIHESNIKRIIILHSHFDHCGIVPFLKKRWPWAIVTASVKSKELMMLPKYIDAVETMNKMALEKYGLLQEAEKLDLSFHGINVEHVVKDGDKISFGDRTLQVLDVPGHSSCSIAVYVPEEKALFASDAGGIPFGDNVFTAANSDFDKYYESLTRMASLDITIHLAEHYGARTGEDGKSFLKKSLESAVQTRKLCEELLNQTKDIKKSAEELTNMIMKDAPSDFLPKEIIYTVAEQMLKSLWKKMKP